MVETYVEDFFVANRFLLQWAGLWPPRSNDRFVQNLYKIYHITLFSYISFFTTTTVIELWEVYGEPKYFLKCFSSAFVCVLIVYKAIFFMFNGDKIKKILETLETDEFHYEDLKKKDFYPGEISKKYKRTGILNSFGFFCIVFTSVIANYTPLIIALILYVMGGDNSKNKLPTKLPYSAWMPFKYDTAFSYFWALVFQIIPALNLLFCNVGVDTLFMNILYNINLQLTLIQGAFLTIRENAVRKTKGPQYTFDSLQNPEELTKHLHQEMRKICRHQQTVYRASEDLENICGYLTLGQFGSTLLVLCSCLYLVTLVPLVSPDFLYEMIYLIFIVVELFIYCWFGNEVTFKADQLHMAMWECDWISADAGFKKHMIFAMQRVQKPLYFKAGKLVPLTLETFVGIVRRSYSFFAVIRSMESKTE